jgi:hypothetical protein
MRYILFLLLFTGCDFISTKYKCENGVLLMKINGAWVEAYGFKDRKCLPPDEVNE